MNEKTWMPPLPEPHGDEGFDADQVQAYGRECEREQRARADSLAAQMRALSRAKVDAMIELAELRATSTPPDWAVSEAESALRLLDAQGYVHTGLAAVRDWLASRSAP